MPNPKNNSTPYIAYHRPVPSEEGRTDWDRIRLNGKLRMRLLKALCVQMNVARRDMRATLGIYGMLLLYGPPGVGKTTIAKALATAVLDKLKIGRGLLLGINCHAIFSSELGGSQKNVQALFAKLRELAASGVLLFVVIDEVETLVASRAALSTPANPHDLQSAVSAFIENWDAITREFPNVFFIATTNHPSSIDPAILDRFDERIEIGLPNGLDRLAIIAQSLKIFQPGNCLATKLSRAAAYSTKRDCKDALSSDAARQALVQCQALLKEAEGLSPRQLSRMPIRCVVERDAALDRPITLSDLVLTAKAMRRTQ